MLNDLSKMKVVIVGATTNEYRYAYFAAEMLHAYGYEFFPVGIKNGFVFGREILDIRNRPPLENVDTITLYIGPRNQPEHYKYLFSLNPKRIIFNPGTENPDFILMAEERGIIVQEACTLVMLRLGNFNNYCEEEV